MADFCLQCNLELFNTKYSDFAGVTSKRDSKKEKYCIVVCEGCGVIQVDHMGRCVSGDCLVVHGIKE